MSPDKSEYGLKLTVVGGCQNMVAGSSRNMVCSELLVACGCQNTVWLQEALTIRVADLQLTVAGGSQNLDCS